MISRACDLLDRGGIENLKFVNNILEQVVSKVSNNRESVDLFHKFFLQLLDRMFGKELTTTDIGTENTTGGWFRELISPDQHRDRTRENVIHVVSEMQDYYYTISEPAATILLHLNPHSGLFRVMSQIRTGGYEIKISTLPLKARLLIAKSPLYACMASHQHDIIYQRLLKTNLSRQSANISMKGTLMLDEMELFLFCFAKYPAVSGDDIFRPPASKRYLNRALSAVKSLSSSSSRYHPAAALMERGINAWINEVPYLILLQQFLCSIFPDIEQSKKSDHAVEQTEDVQFRMLFVLLASEFWVDTATVVRRDHHRLDEYRKLYNNASTPYSQYAGGTHAPLGGGKGTSPSAARIIEPKATTISVIDSSSLSWKLGSLQCLYMLVLRLLSDPDMLDQVTTLSRGEQGPSASQPYGTTVPRIAEALQDLRQPVFDLLRSVFLLADQDSARNGDVALLAIEIWLLWCQPWLASQIADQKYPLEHVRRSTSSSLAKWKPYIIENIHFYCTIAPCYFKMLTTNTALSVKEYYGYNHLLAMRRVLRMLNDAEIMDHVDRSLERVEQYVDGDLSRATRTMNDDQKDSLMTDLRVIAKHHAELFPAPTAAATHNASRFASTISSTLETDLKRVVDSGITNIDVTCGEYCSELVGTVSAIAQLMKVSQFMRAISNVGAFVGLLPSMKGDDKRVALLESAKKDLITFLPAAAAGEVDLTRTSVLRTASGSAPIKNGVDDMNRDFFTGRLAPESKLKLMEGVARCTPRGLARRMHYTDPLHLPLCSYEIKPVSRKLIAFSQFLNEKYMLPADKKWLQCTWYEVYLRSKAEQMPLFQVLRETFRFNLRGLGSKRVFVVTVFALICLLGMMGIFGTAGILSVWVWVAGAHLIWVLASGRLVVYEFIEEIVSGNK